MNKSSDEEMMMEDKLHVLDSFEQAGGPCCIPSIKMLQMILFSKVIREDCFKYDNGSLLVKDFGIIDGITYQISDSNFIVSIDSSSRVTQASINNNNELELSI